MKKIDKIIKIEILYCIIFTSLTYIIFLPLACFCSEACQTVVITQQDIINAKPTKETVQFDQKDLKAIEMMERRHFPRTYPEFSDCERLKNLEYELLGRVWEYTPQKDRIKKLKIASSNTMLIGVALPPKFKSKKWQKRMRNDNIQLRERENVGLIDGFLKLMNPDLYEQFRIHEDRIRGGEYEY